MVEICVTANKLTFAFGSPSEAVHLENQYFLLIPVLFLIITIVWISF